ncbi:sigma-54 dependent transcriptional regulator [Thalassotalea mangrovi]|uniref:Sigma-54-dependent Fis family transcriptional regulator n=1 Tax=Thalassotalea mangrovi TaxID=2572245 RepID=A0A4U1B1K8_9GAMM|nr:sigma-54 dependent transcriptional regulator [Thalassotalea mangrovi]TKB43204.1 sigma-54-dependent Fis family transcriptional regulator [Thalassotalea mangrovi]
MLKGKSSSRLYPTGLINSSIWISMKCRDSNSILKRTVLVIGPPEYREKIEPELSNWRCLNCEINQVEQASALIQQFAIRVMLVILENQSHQQIFSSLDYLHGHHPEVKHIALINDSHLQKAQLLFPRFFHDYHHFPVDSSRLEHTLGHAYGLANIAQSRPRTSEHDSPLNELVGDSFAMQQFRQKIQLVAQSSACVLLLGETGTGKDLAAQTIHKLSERSNGPFININCAAFPEHLIQSELFGHEKGSFTGAVCQHKGKIEQAHGGTLFLNEIGELPLQLQAVLLKFLDDKIVERIGANSSFQVDCRIIAATHNNLESAVSEGKFREDLYHRLNILQLESPPLRDRENDAFIIAQSHLGKFSGDTDRILCDEFIAKIKHYHWPGNIRELLNYIERAQILGTDELPNDRKEKSNSGAQRNCKKPSELQEAEIVRAIEDSKHNLSEAAKSLNISRTSLYRIIEKSNLKV